MWFWKQLNLWFLIAKIQPGVDFRRGKWQCLGVIKITVHSMPYLIRHTLCTCNMRENSRRVGRSAAPAVSPDIHPSTTPPTTPVLRVTPTVYLPNSSARKIVFAAGAVFSASFFFFSLQGFCLPCIFVAVWRHVNLIRWVGLCIPRWKCLEQGKAQYSCWPAHRCLIDWNSECSSSFFHSFFHFSVL